MSCSCTGEKKTFLGISRDPQEMCNGKAAYTGE